jgi:4-hydroxybutyrate dehydrogenase/sulfolactaldehyde 3-reductase
MAVFRNEADADAGAEMEVAFIGLGVMGSGMARNLIKGGHRVRVFDVSKPALDSFRNADCRIAASPQEAADAADAVMCMLPDSPHVREALLGPQGALCKLKPRGLVIDMSTISAHDSDGSRASVLERGFRFIDAPIGRTPRDAAAGTSLVIAGGLPEDIADARPLFDCIGDKLVHAGGHGTGIRLKLVNNYMSTVGTMLAAEALALASKVGLDRALTVEVLSNTTAGRGQLNINYPKKVLAGDLVPDFPLRMAHKDISHALSLGAMAGVPLLLGAITREAFNLAKPWQRENEDWTAMLLLLEDIARIEHGEPIYPAPTTSP